MSLFFNVNNFVKNRKRKPEKIDNNNISTVRIWVEKSGSCEGITIIQPALVQNNTWFTVLLSVGMCHTTNFNSVSIEHTDRSAFSTSTRDLRLEQNNSAPKASSTNFNGAIVQRPSFVTETWDCESKCFLWHVTKVVFQYTLRLLLYVYTRCYFPVIFNLLQDSSHWTVFLCFPLLFLVM